MKRLSIAAIILAVVAIAGEAFIFATKKEDSEALLQRAIMADYHVYAPVLPDTLTFAGERVPMETYYVREALDNELVVNMYRQSATVMCFKRAGRYFPVIEPILKKNGIPDDFKYLCVIESALTNATSPAKAQGFWQFIKSTGTTYGLEVNDEVDMRNNLEASTEAACKYIKSLYNRFGSWTAAAAAYNCGENGLAKRMDLQSIKNYYDLLLNTETSRYVYRILAMKTIMQNPARYGYHLRHCDLFPPIPTRTIILEGKNIDLYQVARENGTTYRMVRTLNPWLLTDHITNKAGKSYNLKMPVEKGTLYRTLTHGHRDTSPVTSL
ncbi:MAG: lytic transglycosylase domain-containing protein [Bacteroidales bacterium]|nr:lytic transglycosylase domain-containing protein [Bacteroidales bacterium]